MLSIENPPPDPSCSYRFPLLNSNSDERASASDHKPAAEEVDLPNSDLDHHTPLPNFSIRDYVFKARSKDIKKNWPFSLKNLQLCLKHGVKELLPPLKPLDKVSKKSLKRCMVGASLAEKEKTGNHEVLDTNSDDPQLNNKLVESCLDISSCRYGDENDFPSTTTSVSHSEIESLTVNNKLSTSKTETHPGTLAADESAGPSGNNKKTTENTSGPLSKKCRLIVKFGGNFDRISTEDIVSNSATVSEIMASKVCPVCKAFSSSSNTTLNAHIDQCLSVKSTPNLTSDSKLTRHRIKPRKMRLMVDIYTTALPCTLEELDRRNGTTWATVSCLPRKEVEKTGNAETINEGKKMRVSHIHPEDIGDVGPVYIDANGTKLRILSKFDDQPLVSKLGEDIEARKRRKGDKEGKYMLKKKKKGLAQKHHKFLNLASKNKMNFFQKARGSQEEECKGEAKICEKDHIVSKQTKPSDAVTLRPWVCFKRRGFTKKTCQEGELPVRCNWHLPQDLLAYNGQSFLGETLMERNVVQKFANLSENPISSAKNYRTNKSFRKVLVCEKREQSPRRKKMGNLLVPGKPSDNLGHSPVKLNSVQSENCGTSVNDSLMTRPSNSMCNHSSLLRKRAFEACGAANISDISCIASTKSSGEDDAIPSVGMEFSSRKNMMRVSGRSSVTESVCGKVEKFSALEKSQLHLTKERNRDEVSRKDREYDLMGGNPENLEEREDESFEMNTVLEPRQGRGILCVSQGEGRSAMSTKSPSPHFYDHDVLLSADSSAGAGDDFLLKVDCLDPTGNQVHVYVDDVAVQPSSNTSDGRSVACTIKSIDLEFYGVNNSLHGQPDSLLSVEDYRRVLCGTEAPLASTEPDFVNDRDIFSADEGVAGQDSRIAAELDSEGGYEQSFPVVDPILIPGPPGSFLPSPRDMDSEDFQGNASLTTSRIHSSPDQHDPVDGDSSDSPISAASTISNSPAERCNFQYSEPSSSVGPYDRVRSTAASVESSLQSADTVAQASGAEVEGTAFDGGYLKLDRIYVDKGSLSFKNDQPCCCQRKERLSQAVALNFQESQLLIRRKMASMTIPAGGKRIDFNSNLRSVNLDVGSEFVPPGSCANLGSEKMVLPITKPLSGAISFEDSPSPVGVNFLARADPGSASPSASNPVLRLMGKNLLVVNKDEDTSVPAGGVRSHIQNKTQTSQFLAFSEVSPHSIHNHDSLIGSQASVNFGQRSHKPTSQFYDDGLLNSFRLPVNGQLPAGMFQGQHTDYSFGAPSEYHELKGDSNISSGHVIFNNRPNADGMEKITKAPECHFQRVDYPQNPVKEIIIVDDVSESKNIMIGSAGKCAEGGRECPVVVPPGIPIPEASEYDPNCVHPLSCYQSQAHDYPPAVESVNYHANPSKLANTCPVRWSCTSEGSGVLPRLPLTALSYSPGHVRSTAHYYLPGFT